jgi:hypothetical protein
LNVPLALYPKLEKYSIHLSNYYGLPTVAIMLFADADMELLHVQSYLKTLQDEDHTSIFLLDGNPCS